MAVTEHQTECVLLDQRAVSPLPEPVLSDQSLIDALALQAADLNALRVALHQLTGDPELGCMPLEFVPTGIGRVWQTVVQHDYQDRVRQIAISYLSRDIPPPDQASTLELPNPLAGRALKVSTIRLAMKNLAYADLPAPNENLMSPV
ncbi:MAG: hypothetical protein Q8L23_06955 [Caulobacter sp.]|nr:hypothetical protein [Caulobacter sp.]